MLNSCRFKSDVDSEICWHLFFSESKWNGDMSFFFTICWVENFRGKSFSQWVCHLFYHFETVGIRFVMSCYNSMPLVWNTLFQKQYLITSDVKRPRITSFPRFYLFNFLLFTCLAIVLYLHVLLPPDLLWSQSINTYFKQGWCPTLGSQIGSVVIHFVLACRNFKMKDYFTFRMFRNDESLQNKKK